ncbi:hypothetical protein BKA67DRAFT_655023 [Truncatella angustata]|uniref:Uncharacterized protein n=1 Tax=Truncatella angustata TaxID=152316 RepID=A0A9P8UR53_9PEZI|nr:uncharacterized protein BKA67DRAFT_655023 [Truncatella angustata]KAH6656709.1 hypothetical protein BKA67DRAFT_655023 [Truncatella angustata]
MKHANSTAEVPGNMEGSGRKAALDGADAELPKLIGLSNAPKCMAACRTEFTKGLDIDVTRDPALALEILCHKIVDDHLGAFLWDLYCCDTKYCGLGVVGTAARQDPNVDGIIDQCKNIGISGIVDPGPPQRDRCGPTSEDPFKVMSISSGTADHGGFTGMQIEISTTSITSLTPIQGDSPAITTETGTDALNTSTPMAPTASSVSLHGLKTGDAVAIGVCATIAALALFLALLCVCRRRRRSKVYIKTPPRSRAFVAHDQPPTGSRAKLVTSPHDFLPKSLQPLTPPMRLRDRRYLSPVTSHHPIRSFFAPSYSSQSESIFPEHSIPPRTTGKPLPRYTRHAVLTSIQSDTVMDTLADVPRSSMSSVISRPTNVSILNTAKSSSIATTTTTTTTTEITNPARHGSPPLSPIRPQRPHNSPLNIPGLLMPVTPPPEHALPPAPSTFHLQSSLFSPPIPPPKSPLSPAFSVSPLSLVPALKTAPLLASFPSAGEIGVAIGAIGPTSATGVALQPSSHVLCGLTGTHDQQTCVASEGWHSWSNTDGGEPKAKRESPRLTGGKASGSEDVSTTKKLNLENLGGSY